ncbi:unnamed protein product [Symbiodinium natans]|uniref:Uncharacterized protein n=1 Tax=Symbiodinium natans TaxID=878477 RepID=A0A812V5R1_9DINO|nr:unnamed protein product [Symbiodinium natans]
MGLPPVIWSTGGVLALAVCRSRLAAWGRLRGAFRTRHNNFQGFLRALEAFISSRIQREERDDRSEFTINYKLLFDADPWAGWKCWKLVFIMLQAITSGSMASCITSVLPWRWRCPP